MAIFGLLTKLAANMWSVYSLRKYYNAILDYHITAQVWVLFIKSGIDVPSRNTKLALINICPVSNLAIPFIIG